jgi:hypothetical protein
LNGFLSGKNKKSKSRANPANKKTRPKKLPKAKLHNTSYRSSRTKDQPCNPKLSAITSIMQNSRIADAPHRTADPDKQHVKKPLQILARYQSFLKSCLPP